MHIQIKKLVYFLCFLVLSTNTIAAEVKTDGGIEVFRSEDNCYWFKLHGIAKVDAVFFPDNFAARQGEFPSGANIRALETTFNGGIGRDLSYSITLGYETGNVIINDAYVMYSGFKDTEISIGQVISPFCLENANSSKWIPFLERSLPVIALKPCLGVGVNFTTWGDHYGLILASTTPPHGQNKDTNVIKHRSDNLTNTIRGYFVPINGDHKVLQIGASGVYAQNDPIFRDGTPNIDGRRFATRPEARARNTPFAVDSGNALLIDYYNEYAIELGAQYGPFVMNTEYLQANIHRMDQPTLKFYGWYAQAAYVLTGESRAYNIKKGAFGQIKPKCCTGAWEVAARYSMVNLNDEDLHGGKENNVSLALTWIANQNWLVMANYIYASIDPTQAPGARMLEPDHRYMNILGFRSQIVW